MIREQQDVGLPLPQRRDEDREDVEPVEQVFAERARGNGILEVLVGRRDQPHVDLDRLDAAEPLELMFLEDPQQLHLDPEIDVADLVEEERPAVRALEPSQSCVPPRR